MEQEGAMTGFFIVFFALVFVARIFYEKGRDK